VNASEPERQPERECEQHQGRTAQAPGPVLGSPVDGRQLRLPGDYRQRSLLVPSVSSYNICSESQPGGWRSNPLLLTLMSILVPSMRVRYMRRFI